VADYPTLATSYGSDPKTITKFQVDRAEDGTARIVSLSNDKVSFQLRHEYITSAEKTTLDSFYTTNRLLTFTYLSPSDSVSRTCLFSSPINYKKNPDNSFTAEVAIEEA